jgi:SNF2 family DNA or RNA helicase
MDEKLWTYLFYDKCANNERKYSNIHTKDLTVEYLFTSNHIPLEGASAIESFNSDILKLDAQLTSSLICKLNPNVFTPYYFKYIESGITKSAFIIAIHNENLYKYVLGKIKLTQKEIQILKTLCSYHILYENAKLSTELINFNNEEYIMKETGEIIKNAMIPNADITDQMIEQPKFTNALYPLYDYQKQTIFWMRDKEKHSKDIYYKTSKELIIGKVLYSLIGKNFICNTEQKKITFSGGALIDEVGLGKTYQMISMALCDNNHDIEYVKKDCNKICSRATLIICPNQVGQQWVSEINKLISEKKRVIPLFTKTNWNKYTYQDILDADFVIVTFNFLVNACYIPIRIENVSEIQQIKNESKQIKENIEKILEKNPNIYYVKWRRIIIDEIHELYTSIKYKKIQEKLSLFSSDFTWCVSATPFADSQNVCLINMFKLVTKMACDNQCFTDKQVIEYMKNSFFRRNTKLSIQSEYKIPEIKETPIFLDFTQTEMMLYEAFATNKNLPKYDVKLRQLCCHPQIVDELRNILGNCKTLEDVEKQMGSYYTAEVNIKQKELEYAEFKIKMITYKISIAKAKIYKSHLKRIKDKVKLIINIPQLDTDYVKNMMMLKNKNIDDQDDNIIDDNSDSDDEIKYKEHYTYTGTEQDINNVKKYLKTLPITVSITNLEDRKLNYIAKYTAIEKEYKGKVATQRYFEDVKEKLQKIVACDNNSDDLDETEDCIVCMDTIKKNDLGVTKCGHIFCYGCITEVIAKLGSKCPVCKTSLAKNDLHHIIQLQPKIQTEQYKSKQELINNVGTKLAHLIEFLKEKNEHAIIFSQWDDLLHKVGGVLTSSGIKNVFCKGNVWMRGKAIKEFNENDDIKVIMLSSESAASGTNLTKAKYVILLDPVYGTYEYRRNIEWQAIGRAHRMGQTKEVEVIRFIIKSTIEEEIYNENKKNDKPKIIIPTF